MNSKLREQTKLLYKSKNLLFSSMVLPLSLRNQKIKGFTLSEIALVFGIGGLMLAAVWQGASMVNQNYANQAFDRDMQVFVNNMVRLHSNGIVKPNGVDIQPQISTLSSLYSMGVLPGAWAYAKGSKDGTGTGGTVIIDGKIPLPYNGVSLTNVSVGGMVYSGSYSHSSGGGWTFTSWSGGIAASGVEMNFILPASKFGESLCISFLSRHVKDPALTWVATSFGSWGKIVTPSSAGSTWAWLAGLSNADSIGPINKMTLKNIVQACTDDGLHDNTGLTIIKAE